MRKFIITSDGTLRYGDVRMHKDLLLHSDACRGGGYYEFDYVSNRFLLTGSSGDFGAPRWDSVDVLHLPGELRGLTVLYEGDRLDLPFDFY